MNNYPEEMADPTADEALSPLESNLYNTVQNLLKETNCRKASQKGILRWSLQKKLEMDQSCSVSLIRVLLRELEQKLKRTSEKGYTHIIPLLHTLYYVVIQSGAMVPSSLYQTVYDCLMKLLILPSPYSSVALSTLRSIKMEMITPGSLYQRKVMAEQNLKNEHFTLQEKVFVLADPAVFSAPLEEMVRAQLQVSSLLTDTHTVENNFVLRVLLTGLGTTCQSSKLAEALEALEDHMADKYFQKVVVAVEQSIKCGTGGRTAYLKKLQNIYTDILDSSKEDSNKVDDGSVCGTAMPFPKINFLLWSDDEDLWNLLANFAEERDKTEDSIGSDDRKIEQDLKESDFDDTEGSPPVRKPVAAFTRRNAYKSLKPADKLSLMREKIEAFPGSAPPVTSEDSRRHTARVVVMGDDRVLGRLTRAYHSIRERESKRLTLTKKLNLRLYYIPVTDVEPSLSSPDSPWKDGGRLSLSTLLGRVDPWYNSNINTLGAQISKLAGMHFVDSAPLKQNAFLLDTLCYYLRCGTQPVHLPLYSVKMTRFDGDVVEEVFVSHLKAEFPEFRHLKEKKKVSNEPSSRRKKSTVEVFGAFISVCYTKNSLSKREVVKKDAPMICGVEITSEPAAVTSGENYLAVRFDSLNPGSITTIRIQNICIKTMEHRALCVCLDQDSRRTYTDIQRMEISPCLDPGCGIRSKFSVSSDRELPLSKYLNNALSLPVFTFTGVTP